MSGRYVFTNVGTGTVDPVDESAYVVDVEVLDDKSRAVLEDADHYGHYGPDAVSIVESVAMPLEAAVDIVEALRRVVQPSTSRSFGWVGTGTLRVAVSMLDAELDGPLDEVRRLAVADLRRALLTLDSLSRLEGVRS